jgi:hypothetical protein
VRQAPRETLVVTNGFSCREQIAQGAGRHTLHIAELALRALAEGRAGPSGRRSGCVEAAAV